MQRRIADILSAYDELIENSQRRIRILEAMARPFISGCPSGSSKKHGCLLTTRLEVKRACRG